MSSKFYTQSSLVMTDDDGNPNNVPEGVEVSKSDFDSSKQFDVLVEAGAIKEVVDSDDPVLAEDADPMLRSFEATKRTLRDAPAEVAPTGTPGKVATPQAAAVSQTPAQRATAQQEAAAVKKEQDANKDSKAGDSSTDQRGSTTPTVDKTSSQNKTPEQLKAEGK